VLSKSSLLVRTFDPLLSPRLRHDESLRWEMAQLPSQNCLLRSREKLGGYFDGHNQWMRPLYNTTWNAHYADAYFHLGRLEEAHFSGSTLASDQVQSQRGERSYGSVEVSKAEWKALKEANSDLPIGCYDEWRVFWGLKGPPDGKYKVRVFRRFRQDAYFWRYQVALAIYRDHWGANRAVDRHVERTSKDEHGLQYTDMEPIASVPNEHINGYFGHHPQGGVDLREKFAFTEAYLVPRLCAATRKTRPLGEQGLGPDFGPPKTRF